MTTYGTANPDQAVTIDYTNWRGERAEPRTMRTQPTGRPFVVVGGGRG